MMPREFELLLTVLPEDGKISNAEAFLFLLKYRDPVVLKFQPSKSNLDRQFSETGGAPEELVFAVFNDLVGLFFQLLGVRQHP